jgi:hypothetical protein
MPAERIVIKTISEDHTPGDVIMVDGHPYTFTGNRGFVNKTLSEPFSSFSSCAAGITQTGGTIAEQPPWPTENYCTNTDIDVELDKMYVNPFPDVPIGSKVFFNGRGFIKTGNKGTATHVLSAQPVVVAYSAICPPG